jgi:hypothetical protein
MISKEERAELRRLLSAVTLPMPLEATEDGILSSECDFVAGCDEDDEQYLEIGQLIAAAVNSAPKLLDALDASDERIANLEAEVARFRKLFDDAGQGEHNVLALVDHYQECVIEADDRAAGAQARIAELEEQVAALKADCLGACKCGGFGGDVLCSVCAGTGGNATLQSRIAELEATASEQAELWKLREKEHDLAARMMIRRNEELKEAKTRIAELEAADQWRPIEGAPKDGKDWLIVARAGTPFRGPAYWFHGHWCQGNNAELHFTPTHFCELPDAPALPEGGA